MQWDFRRQQCLPRVEYLQVGNTQVPLVDVARGQDIENAVEAAQQEFQREIQALQASIDELQGKVEDNEDDIDDQGREITGNSEDIATNADSIDSISSQARFYLLPTTESLT